MSFTPGTLPRSYSEDPRKILPWIWQEEGKSNHGKIVSRVFTIIKVYFPRKRFARIISAGNHPPLAILSHLKGRERGIP